MNQDPVPGERGGDVERVPTDADTQAAPEQEPTVDDSAPPPHPPPPPVTAGPAASPVDQPVDQPSDQPSDRAGGKARRTVTMPVAVPVTVALVLGLALGLILGWVIPRPGDASASVEDDGTDGAAQASELDPAAPQPLPGGPDGTEEFAGLVIGTEGGLVEVFEDYVCPFCARLELASGAQLRQAAESGEYRLVLHPVAFLTEDSPRAANASACAYQHEETDVWFALHELMYQRQDPSEAVGQYSTENLLAMADEVGAGEQTASCIEDGTYVDWVAAVTQQAFDRGVTGTPTVAVDGRLTDVTPLIQ